MKFNEINSFIKKNVEEIYDEMVKIRRKIHMNPELGDEEFETSATIKEFLKNNGIEYEEIINTGIVATIYNGEGKTVATRADIDALPIFEENEVEYKSKINGKMHACGHDAHITIQMGVAKILANNKDKWKGTVRFFFQPAEETNGGAERMIKAGALKFKNDKNKKIDAFFALHMAPEIELGKIGVKYGKAHATSAMITLNINGVSAHAALPHKGVDAILIGAKVLEFFQSIISRRIDPREEAVITVGSFKGGKAENVICDKVEMLGTIRTMSKETRMFIIETIKRDLPKFVESLGGNVDINIREGYAPVINNDEITQKVEENVVDLYGKESLELIKGCFFRLGTRNEEKGLIYDLHHPKFNIDGESLKIGIGLQLKNILEFLK